MAPPLSHDISTIGKRLLPHIIDARALTNHTRPFALYPQSRDPAQGFRTVTYADLSRAVNRASWWLDANLSAEKDEYFAYFGPSDLRYWVLFLAVMKTGRRMLIASPRNPLSAQLSLFAKVDCKTIISCASLDTSLQPLFKACSQRKICAPVLDELLDVGGEVRNYAFDETYESAAEREFLTAHTSGSSGNPKPIVISNGYFCRPDLANCVPEGQGPGLTQTFIGDQNILNLLPAFHGGGLCIGLLTVYVDGTLVLGHPKVPTSVSYTAELLKAGVITAMLSPPSILEGLSQDPSAINDMAKLKHVAYGGGPLRPDIGNMLAKQLPHLFSFIGATEVGWFHAISGPSSLWDSVKFFSDIGYRFDEVTEGIFEFVVVSDERTNRYHGVFEVFPGLQEYRTKDLYSPSGEEGWWRYRGRSDDLIVLSNGEKVNPIPMENIIGSHTLIKAALVVGEYRFSASLLIETVEDRTPNSEEEQLVLLDEIWPAIQAANVIAPGYAKIPKSLVLFGTPGKPFLRAGKGTVQRQMTVKVYTAELDLLYASQSAGLLIEGLTLGESHTEDDIRTFVREIYTQALDVTDLDDTDDVFHRGMDSLRIAVVVQRLKAAMEVSKAPIDLESINTRLAYAASSIEKMTNAVLGLMRSESQYKNGVAAQSRTAEIEDLINKYSQWFPAAAAQPAVSSTEPWTIILTGTTGSLGTYLLSIFEQAPESKISRIICLNRSADGKGKQMKADLNRGVQASWHLSDSKRVKFLQADLAKLDFGLGTDVYKHLQQTATIIIHNAWQVDFNLSISSFEPQIRGLRNLLEFSAQSTHSAPVIFISSIAASMTWQTKHPTEKVPEAIITDLEAPEHIGYGESKFVGEHMLQKFSQATGIRTAVFRTGQIGGPVNGNGVWNKGEWLPSVIASSKYLGVLPETMGSMDTIDWVPVDVLAGIMLELTKKLTSQKSQSSGETIVYNLVNPKTTTWSALLGSVKEYMGIAKTVPLKKWVHALEQSSHDKQGAIVAENPSVKLLDFFRTLSINEKEGQRSRYEVGGLVRDSSRAEEMTAVTPEWMGIWMRQWNF